MRIYDSALSGIGDAARAHEVQSRDSASSTRSGNTGASGDQVQLSSDLSRISRALDSSGTQRSARVQELADLYSSGQYQADAAGTSRGMVSEALGGGVQ
jgi:hypothetical protein